MILEALVVLLFKGRRPLSTVATMYVKSARYTMYVANVKEWNHTPYADLKQQHYKVIVLNTFKMLITFV